MDETGGKQEGKRRHKSGDCEARPWALKDSEVLYKKKNQPIVKGEKAEIQNKSKRAWGYCGLIMKCPP